MSHKKCNHWPIKKLFGINLLSSRLTYLDVIFILKLLGGTIDDSFLSNNINIAVAFIRSRNRPTFHISRHRIFYGLFFSPINRALFSCKITQYT